MKVTLNIEKRYAYAIMGLLIIVGGFFIVNAALNVPTPNPGHDVTSVVGAAISCYAENDGGLTYSKSKCGQVSGWSNELEKRTVSNAVHALYAEEAGSLAGSVAIQQEVKCENNWDDARYTDSFTKTIGEGDVGTVRCSSGWTRTGCSGGKTGGENNEPALPFEDNGCKIPTQDGDRAKVCVYCIKIG
jgi:hypothetical protein